MAAEKKTGNCAQFGGGGGGVSLSKKGSGDTPQMCTENSKSRLCWPFFVLSLFRNTIICIVIHCSIVL